MIRVREYPDRMHWFKVHFELLHQALAHFSSDKAAINKFVAEREKEYSSGLDSYIEIEGERTRDLLDDMIVTAYGNNLKRDAQTHVEFAENKLHQTEIVLRCAFFEAEMKDIHHHCLCAEPKRLKADKKIDLGRIVAKGEETVVEEEIKEEVDRLDRQNVRARADYFVNVLGLKWADPQLSQQFYRLRFEQDHEQVVMEIKKYSDLRNKIVHEDTDYVVKHDELSGSRNYFTFVPSFCCLQAVKLYPTHFAEK